METWFVTWRQDVEPHSGETPFGHADGTTPVETCAAATDRTRFFVVFGTAGATDELFSKYVCP